MAERNFENRTMFHGDNIDFLQAMNSDTVDLIATDPPFNKGRDFHATPDSLAAGASFQDRWKWDEEAHPRFTDALKNKAEHKKEYANVWTVIESARSSWGDDMGAFLCFMGVRLMEMHRVLKPTGSIYLHCDPTASHYLKALMDAVFGRKNFRNEIQWMRYRGKRAAKNPRKFPAVADYVLFYAKSKETKFNLPFGPLNPEYVRKVYRYDDNDGKGPYRFGGRIRDRKYYLSNSRGVPLTTWWDDVPELNGTNAEMTGYPSQKPLAMYKRMIEASSNPDDMVLDPFAGCATTCVAAERIGRRWIGIDIWEEAYEVVLQRLQDEGLAVKEGRRERSFYRFSTDSYLRGHSSRHRAAGADGRWGSCLARSYPQGAKATTEVAAVV